VRPIPLVDVKAQYEPLLPRIREAIDGVLERGEFILGPNVAAFEREAADYLGARETIGVANGTDALVQLRDGYASTLEEDTAREYEAAFNRAVRRRFGELALELEEQEYEDL